MSDNVSENEIFSIQSDLIKSTKELNDSIRDILENGTIEQKVDLLVRDYQQRMVNEEFKLRRELQNAALCSYMCQFPIMPKFY